MTRRLHASMLVSVAAALLSACSTMHEGTTSAFPAGKYSNGDTVVIFNADGTYVGTTTQGEDWVRGTYTHHGNEVTLSDSWESEGLVAEMGKSCMGNDGRYTWALSGDVFTATVIEDPCEGRVAGTSGVAWTRMR